MAVAGHLPAGAAGLPGRSAPLNRLVRMVRRLHRRQHPAAPVRPRRAASPVGVSLRLESLGGIQAGERHVGLARPVARTGRAASSRSGCRSCVSPAAEDWKRASSSVAALELEPRRAEADPGDEARAVRATTHRAVAVRDPDRRQRCDATGAPRRTGSRQLDGRLARSHDPDVLELPRIGLVEVLREQAAAIDQRMPLACTRPRPARGKGGRSRGCACSRCRRARRRRCSGSRSPRSGRASTDTVTCSEVALLCGASCRASWIESCEPYQ